MAVSLTRELTRMRLEHEADLLERAYEVGREEIRRQAQQCRNLRRASEALREMASELEDVSEVEGLSGGAVNLVKGRAA